jgi:hypothetical protein
MTIQIQTISFKARDGMDVVLMIANWNGSIVEADLYRACDMTPLASQSIMNVKGV